MTRLPARFATPQRAYQAGLVSQLRRPAPYAAWRTEQALAAAPPEVAAAYAAGTEANLLVPMPGEAEVLAAVVRQLTGPSPDPGRDTAGPKAGASAAPAAVWGRKEHE